MSAQLRPQAAAARLVLLGTGTVGSAFIARYQALRQRQLDLPHQRPVAVMDVDPVVAGNHEVAAIRPAPQPREVVGVRDDRQGTVARHVGQPAE